MTRGAASTPTSRARGSRTIARAVAGLLLACAGCPAPRTERAQCRYSDECAAGLVCAGNACRAACRADSDCTAPGTTCRPSGRPEAPRACLPRDAPPLCLYTSDCGPTLRCARDGVCRPECQSDRDCAVRAPWIAGAVCRPSDRVCVPAGPAPRLIAPLSGSIVSLAGGTTIRFEAPTLFEAVQLEVCADHACATPTPAGSPTRAGNRAFGYSPGMPGVVYWRLRGLVAGQPAGVPSATWQFTARDHLPAVSLNRGVAPRLDANRDGVPDVVIAAPSSADSAPKLYTYSGSAAPTTTLTLTPTSMPITGLLTFGTSVASVGDMDADGFDDLLAVKTDTGEVSWLRADPSMGLSSTGMTLGLGAFVVRAGDLDGNGRDDALRVQPSGSQFNVMWVPEGRPWLNAPVMTPTGAGTSFGSSVDGVGDVNGDGLDDVVAGDPSNAGSVGAAYFYRGSSPDLVTITPTILRGDGTAGAEFGARVAGVGDVNGDGFADIAVAEVATPSVRRIWFFAGGAAGPEARPGVPLSLPPAAGTAASSVVVLAPLGDVNRDGYADFAAGALDTDTSSNRLGRVFVFYGSADGPVSGPTLGDPNTRVSEFGRAISGPGDLDADGFDDVVVGAPFSRYAYVFRGAASGLLVSTPVPIDVPAPLDASSGFGTAIAP